MNYSWIIDGELMVASLPDSHTMLRLLKSAGIKAIASMCEIPFSDEELAEYGFHHITIPVPDYTKPTLSQLKTFIKWANFMRRMKQPILVHCMAGYGRSATVCAAYLVLNKSMSADDAIAEVREIRSADAIETAEQEGFVHEAEYIKDILVDDDEQGYYNAKMLVDTLRKHCPWDAKQTSESLVTKLLEETYETWEALKMDSPAGIASELGDVLLLMLMIARIESETKNIDTSLVINSMLEKLRTRHPHVFGESSVDTADKVLSQWNDIKKGEEKQIRLISDIPSSLPPLARADRIMAFAKGLGFDWDDMDGVMNKFDEEIAELKDAISSENHDAVQNELGDVFFTLLNVARFAGIKPEFSLMMTLDKFVDRFKFIESESAKMDKPISSMSIDEMEELWNRSKLKNQDG